MTEVPVRLGLMTALAVASVHGHTILRSHETGRGTETALPAPAVALDHVPIAVRDLRTARRHWNQDLGFSLKPGRVHDNSIENAHIKFVDGTALELITAVEPRDALAAAYIDLLEKGGGGAFVALKPADFAQLETTISQAGYAFDVTSGPYYRWLTFPADHPLGYLFFNRITDAPVDSPSMLSHANGALGLGAVWISADRVSGTRQLLAGLGISDSAESVDLPGGRIADRVRLDAGELYLLRGTRAAGPPVAGITIIVNDRGAARRLLRVDSSTVTTGSDARGRFLRVAPASANGVWLEFLEPADTPPSGRSPTTNPMEEDPG